MKIAVLVKQTPQLSEVTVADGSPKWPAESLVVNPFDEYAIEEALRIKEKTGGSTVAISFGNSSSESALRDVLALGIDEAYLITDDHYSSLAPQVNARVLAAMVKKIGDIDLILTGKQASDDDSALVAASVAGHLDWPQIGFVKKFESIDSSKAVVWRTTDAGYNVVEASLPAICSVVKEINEPRLPSLKGKMRAKKAEIFRTTPKELGVDLSPLINIKSMLAPRSRPLGEILKGEPDEVVDKLIGKLKSDQLI